MTSHRRTAAWVGALFLIAMGTSVLGGSIVDAIVGADDYLTSVAESRTQA